MGGGRDRNRNRDRDRHRERGAGPRRERSHTGPDRITGVNHEPGPMLGSVVLLKRPDSSGISLSSSSSNISAKDANTLFRNSSLKEVDQSSVCESNPMTILVRSGGGQGKVGEVSGGDTRVKLSRGLAEAGVKQIKHGGEQKNSVQQVYRFPNNAAIAFINVRKDASLLSELEFISKNSDCTDYFVVTVVGAPQSGKSSILSFLGGSEEFGESKIFNPRSQQQQKEGYIFMSGKRIILIEMPSVFNGSATTDMIALFGSQGTLETAAIAWNLRMMNWAMSVSHVVAIVSDRVIDPNMLQLLSTAPIVNPTDYIFGENYNPEILYVCNKASPSLLENNEMITSCKRIFESTIGRPSKMNETFFVLPQTCWKEHECRFKDFKHEIDDFVRYHRAIYASELKKVKRFPQSLTLAEWYQTATRTWDEFGQTSTSGLSSYIRLLP